MLVQEGFIQIAGSAVGFIIAIGLLWLLPIALGIRAAREKNRSPHWMWFAIHPITGWIAYLILRFSKPRLGQPVVETQRPVVAESPVAEVDGGTPVVLTQVQWGDAETSVPRPRVITVLAVLLMAGALVDAVYLPATFTQNTQGRSDIEAITLLQHDAFFHGWTVFSFWAGALLAIPRFFIGLGLWRRRLWALIAAVWLLWCSVATSVLGMILLHYVIWFRDVPREVIEASAEAKAQRFFIYIVGTLTALVILGFSIYFLRALRNDTLRAHFTGSPAKA